MRGRRGGEVGMDGWMKFERGSGIRRDAGVKKVGVGRESGRDRRGGKG